MISKKPHAVLYLAPTLAPSPGILLADEPVDLVEGSEGSAFIRKSPLGVLLGLNCETELHIDSRRTHHDEEDEDHDHDEFDSFDVVLPEAEEARLRAQKKAEVTAKPATDAPAPSAR